MIVRSLKSPLGLIALGALSLSVHSVFAQTVGGVNAPLGQITTLKPGNYNFEKYQKDAVFQDHVKRISDRSQEAATLYKETIKDYFDAFATFQSFVNETIIKRANDSITKENGAVPVAEYVDLVRQYNEKKNLIELRIKAIATFPEGLKDRVITDAPSSGVNSVSTITAGLDFTKLAKTFVEKLESVDQGLAKGMILVMTKLGGQKQVAIMDASWVTLEYTANEIEKIRREIEEKLPLKAAQRTALTTYTNFLIQKILVMQSEYGTNEKWRQNMHDADFVKRRNDVVTSIANVFWQRSYLRMKYGINVGAIGIKYNTKVFGIDRFFTDMSKIEFYPPTFTENELISRERQLSELFKTAGSKGKTLSAVLHGEADFIDSTNSILAAITGSDQISQVWGLIAGLIVNDLAEEKAMMTGLRDTVVQAYGKRYYGKAANSKNPDSMSDREYFLMQELRLDFNEKRMNQYIEKKLISRRVTRTTAQGPGTLLGEGQKALGVGQVRLATMNEVAVRQAIIDSWNEAAGNASGNDELDDLLGLDNN